MQITAGLEVLRENLRLLLCDRRETSLEDARDLRVHPLARGSHHRVVRGIADERMLEHVGVAAHRLTSVDDVAVGELVEIFAQRPFRLRRHRREQLIAELAAHRGRDLHRIARARGQLIQLRGQQLAQRPRNIGAPLRGLDCARAHDVPLGDRAGELLDEQRHAVGARDDVIEHRARQRRPRGELGARERVDRRAVEAVERHDARVRRGPRRREIRPRREKHQHLGGVRRRTCLGSTHLSEQQREQLEGRRVRPV